MRVFLSALIILVLVGCNSASDEVAVEETTVEVIADSVPLVVEEVDTIVTTVEEVQEIEEINDTNLIRINGDSAVRFGLIYDRESGCVRKGEREFTGVVYRTNNKGVVDCEVKYYEGCPEEIKYYKSNGEVDEVWVFGKNNRMTSFDADSNLIYNDQPFTGYLVGFEDFCDDYLFECYEFTSHYNYDNYNKDSLDKVWDLWDLILPYYNVGFGGEITEYKNGRKHGRYEERQQYIGGYFYNYGYYEYGIPVDTFHSGSEKGSSMSVYADGQIIYGADNNWGTVSSSNLEYYANDQLKYSMDGLWLNGLDDGSEYFDLDILWGVVYDMQSFYETGEKKGEYSRDVVFKDDVATLVYESKNLDTLLLEYKKNLKNYINNPFKDKCVGKSWYKNGQLKVEITNQNMSDNKCWDEKGNKIDCKLIELDDYNLCKSFTIELP